ncbi:DivIVA domain-containing protein [Desulfurobacterium atlanticum]|uniref:Cell division initiation protein n=1 Tax=Desulfurobacterium atlanticum TaxID=240169 RepID=A0A238YWC4_9BACT|nr:DivIVA domain-containing protein [Desulfurobacterium atlanticum]SNR75068.1 cell division initiation protein [Desulfurobacterium atlanticum]
MKNEELKIKPRDIRTKEFSKKVFGYNPDEVDAFLIEVANEFQNLLNKIELLKNSTAEAKKEKILRELKQEIDKKLEEVKLEKKRLEDEKKQLQLEIENLKNIQKRFANKLKLTIIELTRIFEEIKPDDKDKQKSELSDTGIEGSAKSENE